MQRKPDDKMLRKISPRTGEVRSTKPSPKERRGNATK